MARHPLPEGEGSRERACDRAPPTADPPADPALRLARPARRTSGPAHLSPLHCARRRGDCRGGGSARALNDGMGREGRVILGGDASFSLIHRRLSADEQRFLEAHGSLSTVATVRGMARAASGDAALIEIKAVEPAWPRIGQAVFAPPMSLEDALRERDGVFGAAVEEALLARLNLKLGDVIRIGESQLRPSDCFGQRAGSAGDRRRAWAARAHFASGSRRKKTGSAGISGPMDDASCHGRPRRGAGQFRGPGFHG